MLPEFGLAKYSEESLLGVKIMGEKQQAGVTFDIYAKIAKKFNSYVVGGYIEIDSEDEKVCYNSLYLVDRSGELVTNYRKIFLYGMEHDYMSTGSSRPVLNLVNLLG